MRAQFVYEKFTEESDAIRDMGIGLKPKVERWVEERYNDGMFKGFDLKTMSRDGGYLPDKNKIVIRDDLTLDFNGVWIDFSAMTEPIPEYITFNCIDGDFSCDDGNFPLEKLPKIVTNRLKYYVSNYNLKTYTDDDILKYCNAHIIDISHKYR